MRGSTSSARPAIKRVLCEGTPAPRNARRACGNNSDSQSIVVRTPPAAMPSRSHRPDTPVPVPISRTARAPETAASMRSAVPVPVDTRGTPSSEAVWWACRSAWLSGMKSSV